MTADGTYLLDPEGDGAFEHYYCDMTNNGGGWTIVFAQAFDASTGCDKPRMTSDSNVAGNPLSYGWYNINRAKKTAISALSSETIIVRQSSSDTWIKLNRKLFDTWNAHQEHSVTTTSSLGQSSSSRVGWSITGIPGGGDFGLTNGAALDHHSTDGYYNLNTGCEHHFLYQYGQAGYDVHDSIGSWTSTHSCTSECSTRFGFYVAMR